MTPLENVQLKVIIIMKLPQFCFSTNEDAIEGLTNSSGEYSIETLSNDDFVTILANKRGFLAGQRTYVKENKREAEEGNQDPNNLDKEKRICIVLVREALISEEKSILIFTYSNLMGDNFSPAILNSENSKCLVFIP